MFKAEIIPENSSEYPPDIPPRISSKVSLALYLKITFFWHFLWRIPVWNLQGIYSEKFLTGFFFRITVRILAIFTNIYLCVSPEIPIDFYSIESPPETHSQIPRYLFLQDYYKHIPPGIFIFQKFYFSVFPGRSPGIYPAQA